MARNSYKPERPRHTVEEKRRDIARLSKRIKDLEEFDPQSVQTRFSDPAVIALQTAIDETLSAKFGHGTVDYNRYRRAAKLDNGPMVMKSSWVDARGGNHRSGEVILDGTSR